MIPRSEQSHRRVSQHKVTRFVAELSKLFVLGYTWLVLTFMPVSLEHLYNKYAIVGQRSLGRKEREKRIVFFY